MWIRCIATVIKIDLAANKTPVRVTAMRGCDGDVGDDVDEDEGDDDKVDDDDDVKDEGAFCCLLRKTLGRERRTKTMPLVPETRK